eukprot:1149479-Pelagomonas_calceolata.AAC.6
MIFLGVRNDCRHLTLINIEHAGMCVKVNICIFEDFLARAEKKAPKRKLSEVGAVCAAGLQAY